ncbi:unnamed protein product [Polarella glacialis]|uniref:C3H1-type domain-containing protein n=1 Tax=Polarella glacialis TaxID=89957 RepID=A0A813JCU2_POLGL|nr:unnamed protein product [Polarella glacialis]CAE8673236.1 unnamed protein product [Polarella glacialis]
MAQQIRGSPMKAMISSQQGERLDPRIQTFKRTQLCKFYLMGSCSRGKACNFAHNKGEMRQQPDFSKTRLCADFMRWPSECLAGSDCKYAHSQDELRKGGSLNMVTSSSADRGEAVAAQQAALLAVSQAMQVQMIHAQATTRLLMYGRSHADVTQQPWPQKPDSCSKLADGGDFDFSRQTTCDDDASLPAFSRQNTSSSSQECGLPRSPGAQGSVQSDIGDTAAKEGLKVTVMNTFLHFELQNSSSSSAAKRSQSLPAGRL